MEIFSFSTPPAIVQQADCNNNDTAQDDCAAECKEEKCAEEGHAQDDCEQECEDECEQSKE